MSKINSLIVLSEQHICCFYNCSCFYNCGSQRKGGHVVAPQQDEGIFFAVLTAKKFCASASRICNHRQPLVCLVDVHLKKKFNQVYIHGKTISGIVMALGHDTSCHMVREYG